MKQKLNSLVALLAVTSLLVAACATPVAAPVDGGSDAAMVESESMNDESMDAAPTYESWDDVLAAADGTTINWFVWGGSDTINADVDKDIGGPLLEKYNITLNRVPVGDTAEVVNKVLNESAAGVNSGGSVDLVWINGENFRTLKEAGLLYGPWAETIPNAVHVNWDDPALAYDFGYPVEGYESPWGHAQFVMHYDTAVVGDAPPTTFEDLQTWIHDNPSLFTYPAIPDFTGSVFVRHVFMWAAGGPDPFLGDFDQAVFDEYAPAVWEYLNDIEPDLWRGGQTYPEAAQMTDLIANQEIAFNMGYGPAAASTNIKDGTYPDTIRTFVFDTGTLANTNFVAIPFNANNPAAAMVLANYILSPEFQLVFQDPDQWGWLSPTDPTSYDDDFQATVSEYGSGIATLPLEVLNSSALPEPNSDWVTAMEQGWIENVLEQ